MKTTTRFLALALAAVLLLALAACNQPDAAGTADVSGAAGATEDLTGQKYSLSILIPDFVTTQAFDPTSPVHAKVAELTNTEIEWIYVPNTEYDDKLAVTMAAEKLPTIVTNTSMTNMVIPNAIRAGAFWEIGPFLKDYKNLSQANEIVNNNISVDGKIYGVYRQRDLGRLGIGMRSDWLENLGLSKPTTTDELFDVLVAFTNDDPDGNGADDTWGLHECLYNGPFDNISTFFGAPTKWGFEEDGKTLVPAHMTDEYFQSMVWLRDLYAAGGMNADFATLPSDKWRDALREGFAGCRIDTMNDTQAYHEWQVQNAGRAPDDYAWTIIPTVKGPDGVERARPTVGHAGYLTISKSGTNNSEAEMKRVLEFLDRCNDEDISILLNHGIEDLTYFVDENGYMIPPTAEQAVINDKLVHSITQFRMGIPENYEVLPQPNPIIEEWYAARDYNEKIVVGNPCEPLISKTMSEKGNQLSLIYEDARVRFISGIDDEAAWRAACDQWLSQGGTDIIAETQEMYDATQA